MKYFLSLSFLALILLGAFISCSEKEEEPEATVVEEVEPVHPTTNLIRRKIELEEKLKAIIANTDLSGHQELKEAQANAREADQHFMTVQRQHPKLQKLFKKAAGWDGRSSSNNPNQKAKIASMMRDINLQIAEISTTLPELQSAKAAQAAARLKIHTTRRELAGKIPAAKEILVELDDIVSQLEAQRP
ncbi:hypothetical protein N9A94_07250 [Akkermansiaceae bacterium]|nr:hypothetical protein [Akkermansiaceae bacterium]